jgi:hypothetical protein
VALPAPSAREADAPTRANYPLAQQRQSL